MLNTSFWETGVQRRGCAVNNNNNNGGDNSNNNGDDNDNGNDHDTTMAVAAPQPPSSPPAVVLQDQLDKSLRVQACWIRLWDRWACEQRNLVLYQLHINHALSLERSKLTFAGGRVVSCRRFKQQHHGRNAGPTGPPAQQCPPAGGAPASRQCEPPVVVPAAAACEAPAGGSPDARDLRVLSAAVDRLRASGWYYEGPDSQARASQALACMPAGRFCVRDSRHSEHLFTLDVQTGPRNSGGRPAMSVRFTYADGLFGLDSMPRRADALRVPKFRCPIELIDYYVRLSRIEAARQMLIYPVWVDRTGQFFSWMNLRRPMVKTDPQRFPSLKHLTRLLINRHKRLITITPTSLPNELIEYLLQYPYSL